jgi:non-specific serine/threonine protein kinase
LFFISLKAGVGLNITKVLCFVLILVESFAEKQGIGRAHRIGQLNKVNVVRFITKNTVEEKSFGYKKTKNYFRMHCWMKPHQP